MEESEGLWGKISKKAGMADEAKMISTEALERRQSISLLLLCSYWSCLSKGLRHWFFARLTARCASISVNRLSRLLRDKPWVSSNWTLVEPPLEPGKSDIAHGATFRLAPPLLEPPDPCIEWVLLSDRSAASPPLGCTGTCR